MLVSSGEALLADLESTADAFATDEAVFFRLLYKNKNQHRRGVYYRKLQCVKRNHSVSPVSALKQALVIMKSGSAAWEVSRNELSEHLAPLLVNTAVHLKKDIESVCKAYEALYGMFSQTYFMSFSLTFMSILSRFFVLEQRYLGHLLAVIRELASLAPEILQEAVSSESSQSWILDRAFTVESIGFCPSLPEGIEATTDGGGERQIGGLSSVVEATALTISSSGSSRRDTALPGAKSRTRSVLVKAVETDSEDEEDEKVNEREEEVEEEKEEEDGDGDGNGGEENDERRMDLEVEESEEEEESPRRSNGKQKQTKANGKAKTSVTSLHEVKERGEKVPRAGKKVGRGVSGSEMIKSQKRKAPLPADGQSQTFDLFDTLRSTSSSAQVEKKKKKKKKTKTSKLEAFSFAADHQGAKERKPSGSAVSRPPSSLSTAPLKKKKTKVVEDPTGDSKKKTKKKKKHRKEDIDDLFSLLK